MKCSKSYSAYVILASILALGTAAAFLLYSGPFYSFDDSGYILYASQMLRGGFSITSSIYSYGFAVPLSLAASFALFGFSPQAAILPSVLAYLILILLSFLIGRRISGVITGLIAAFITATAPFVLQYVTRVLPDLQLAAVSAAALYLFIVLGSERRTRLHEVKYCAVGFLLSIAVYFKLLELSYMLFFVAMVIVQGILFGDAARNKKALVLEFAWLVAGMSIGIFIYLALFFAASGNPFYALTTYGNVQRTIYPTTLSGNINAAATILVGYLPWSPPAYIDPQQYYVGPVIIMALLGTLYGILRGKREIVGMSVLLWGYILYLFFGTDTISSYSNFYVVTRYFIEIVVPLSVLAAFTLERAFGLLQSRLPKAGAFIIFMVLISITLYNLYTFQTILYYNNGIGETGQVLAQASSYLHAHGGTVYSTDPLMANYLQFLSGYRLHVVVIPMGLRESCSPSYTPSLLALDYNNAYVENSNLIVLKSWAGTNCSFSQTAAFPDNTNNTMAIGVSVYSIQQK